MYDASNSGGNIQGNVMCTYILSRSSIIYAQDLHSHYLKSNFNINLPTESDLEPATSEVKHLAGTAT